MYSRCKRMIALTLAITLSLPVLDSTVYMGPDRNAAAKASRPETIQLKSKNVFRAVRKGSRYQIKIPGQSIQTCKTSKKNIVALRGKGTLKAVKTGKTVITVTTKNRKKYRLSIWVRPATKYNKKTQTVTMIGNSHFRTGSHPTYLKTIAKLYGQKVKILNESHDDYTLENHLKNAQKNRSIRKSLKKADMVVFQEYGGRYTTTLDSILAMKQYCKKNAKLYYFATDYDFFWSESESARQKELERNGITVIDAGALLEKMYHIGFSYDDLHDYNDSHPNSINGYVSSLMIYAQLFREKCTNYPTKQYLSYFEEILPGKTKKQKWKDFKKVCKAADKLNAKS